MIHHRESDMQFLPYPDHKFHESLDEHLQQDDQLTLEHSHDRNGRSFIPNVPVHVKSITAERTDASWIDVLNPYLYTITTEHGPFQWVIHKRYSHFNALHRALVHFVEVEMKRSINDFDQPDETNENPWFPTRNDHTIQERCDILVAYLNKVLKHPKFRHHSATREFFHVSFLSFIHGLSPSQKEGYLFKRSRNDYRTHYRLFRLPLFCNSYDRKWFVVKDTHITYIRSDTNELRFPMLIDHGFMFSSGFRHTGIHYGIKLNNLQRHLVIKCRNKGECDQWKQCLLELIERTNSFRSPTVNRFNSFAPIRQKQLAHWFINGRSYMQAIAKALLTAKDEVYIGGWWISPEIMLIRPAEDETFRLDILLGKIADEGVRVYVIIFKDVPLTMGLNSLHTKRALIGKSQRGFIKVIRYPDHDPKGRVLLWSHHEKMIIIDQKVAFLGGIDLCFGRWDDEHMRLVDLDDENDRNLNALVERLPETVETTQMTEQEGHDDAGRLRRSKQHFRRWKRLTRITSRRKLHAEDEDLPETTLESSPVDRRHRYFIGKDYVNLYEKPFESLEKYSEDYVDRKTVPRMPWHDGGIVLFGQVARDAARHFIQRWNIHKCRKFHNNDSYPFLLPKTYDDDEEFIDTNPDDILESRPFEVDAQCIRSVGQWSQGVKITESSIHTAYIQMIAAAQHYIYIENQFFVSGSYANIRNQVGDALYERIDRAHKAGEKFRVYIFLPLLPGFDNVKSVLHELFFIMSSTAKGEGSLFKRLEKAGVPVNDYISFFGMRTHDVLMGNLVTEIIYVHSKIMIIDDQMAICGSANINDRSLLGHRDSEICVLINDREKEPGAYRNSVCLWIEELLEETRETVTFESNCKWPPLEPGRLNNQPVMVGKCCSSWRKRLFSMMLGIQFENPLQIDITDPVCDQFYRYFQDVARKNTLIYEEVFATLPSDRVSKFDQIDGYSGIPLLKDTDPIRAQNKLKGIQGLVVEYPLDFLSEEDFSLTFQFGEAVTKPVWT